MERRLAEIPSSEWGELSCDITPREYVLDYLAHSFPTQLFEVYSDENGDLHSRPVVDEHGNPVQSREAMELPGSTDRASRRPSRRSGGAGSDRSALIAAVTDNKGEIRGIHRTLWVLSS